jgi:hypothetical protein
MRGEELRRAADTNKDARLEHGTASLARQGKRLSPFVYRVPSIAQVLREREGAVLGQDDDLPDLGVT